MNLGNNPSFPSTSNNQDLIHKYESILASISDGVMAVDPIGNIFLFNEMAEEISGFGREEVIGKNYKKIVAFGFREDLTPDYQFIDRALNYGEITKIQNNAILIGKNVKVVAVEASASPIKAEGNNIIGAIVVFRDVTEEIQLESLKEDFFRITSHELKTPMSVIKGYVHMILDGDSGAISKTTRNYLNDILKVIQREIELVSDLLQVSQFESSAIPYDLGEIDLSQLIKSSTKEITPAVLEKKLTIKLDQTVVDKKWPNVQADPDKVRLILNNLLGNAIKYTNNGYIKVSFNKKNDELITYVSDTGVGIEKKMHDFLFRKFSQVGSVLKRKSGGTGLGLYIARYIAQKMGGWVWLESSVPGKGSIFAFSLPLINTDRAKSIKIQFETEAKAKSKLATFTVAPGSLRPQKST
jgi:PAS domain S-box-containing protein